MRQQRQQRRYETLAERHSAAEAEQETSAEASAEQSRLLQDENGISWNERRLS